MYGCACEDGFVPRRWHSAPQCVCVFRTQSVTDACVCATLQHTTARKLCPICAHIYFLPGSRFDVVVLAVLLSRFKLDTLRLQLCWCTWIHAHAHCGDMLTEMQTVMVYVPFIVWCILSNFVILYLLISVINGCSYITRCNYSTVQSLSIIYLSQDRKIVV